MRFSARLLLLVTMGKGEGLKHVAYALGENVDRIRTTNSGIGFYIDLGYGDLVTGRLGVVPKLNEKLDKNGDDATAAGEQHFSATASVLVKPVDGVKVSAGYVYYAANSAERYLGGDSGADTETPHAWAAAAGWNISNPISISDSLYPIPT